MWGAIIGAAGGLAGSLIGGHNARKEARRQMAIYRNQLREARGNQLRYGNMDYSQSAPAQASLAQARELAESNLANARGSDAITGGHSEQQAIQSNADMSAKVGSELAQAGYQAQKNAYDQYGQQAMGIENQIANVHAQRAQNNTQAGQQALQAGMGLATADMQSHLDGKGGIIENMFSKSGTTKTTSTDPRYTALHNMFGFDEDEYTTLAKLNPALR